jgi:FecR-like protein
MHANPQALLVFLAPVTITWSLANWPPSATSALSPSEPRVTRVNNSVQLLHPMHAPRAARLNDIVDHETVVRTGKDSHAELTFSNETVVRLATNTAFSFKNGTRNLNLAEGAVLVQAPKSANGATIHAAGIAAAITGTTVMIEYHPGVCKFLVLEGTGRLYRPGHLGDSVLVGPGQMVIGDPSAALSDPVNFDIARFVKTSRFFVGLPPLRSESSMAFEAQKQQREKSKKALIETNLVIFGGGTRVSLVGQAQTNPIGPTTGAPATQRPTSSPTPETARASQ